METRIFEVENELTFNRIRNFYRGEVFTRKVDGKMQVKTANSELITEIEKILAS